MNGLRLTIRTVGAITFVLLAALTQLATALADPGTSPAIGWSQVGLSSRVELSGSNQTTDVTVPVPQGVSPTTITGQIGSVVNAAGRVDVSDARGLLLGSIAIPTDVATIPFSVDITQADVTAGVSKLSFVIRDEKQISDSCAQPPAVTLSQLATTYSGPTPNPQTIADFLPGYLDQITIGVGAQPTRDQQQAALALVAKLTHLYRPMPVRIDVDTVEAPTPTGDVGTQRVISIRDSDRPGLVVENPGSPEALLVISGRGQELLRQVELFADRRFELAQTPAVSLASIDQTTPVSTKILSFGELGMAAQASVLGTTTVYVGFDAAAFAVGPIDHARIHLLAQYTPVITADASVVLRSGPVILASHVLDQSGVVDISGDVPAGSIGSNVGLALEIRYIPRGACAPVYDRMTFSVDPQSTVSVSPGTNNRGGFPVLPMAFTPTFDVALDSPDQIRLAAQAINLMGQQSSIALQPNVSTLTEATSRTSGLLVVGKGESLSRAGIAAPLLATGANAVNVDGTPVTGIDLNGPLGIVEAFSQNGRMVLAIETTGDGVLAELSLNHIRGLEGRWASLTGDVVATGAARDTVALTVREGGPMAHQTVPSDAWKWWTWLTIAVGVAALLAVAVVLSIRHRGSRICRRHHRA
ncbi:MAG: hypothetical protein ABW001_04020 [Mycobacterium sp.]